MKQFIFERFPTWLIGAYGGLGSGTSPTPMFDRLASRGLVFDNVFATESFGAAAQEIISPSFDPGVRHSATAAMIDQGITNWFSESAWAELRTVLIGEGYGLSEEAMLSDFVRELDDQFVEEILSEDFLFEFDPVAEFHTASMRLAASRADRRLAAALDVEEEAVILSAKVGGVPPTVVEDKRLDGWRHVPMVAIGKNLPTGRCPDLMDVSTAMLVAEQALQGRIEPSSTPDDQWLQFDFEDSIAIRDHHGLYSREHTSDGVRERFFIKPDDRWNQLNVAAQQGDLLDQYRRRVENPTEPRR